MRRFIKETKIYISSRVDSKINMGGEKYLILSSVLMHDTFAIFGAVECMPHHTFSCGWKCELLQ